MKTVKKLSLIIALFLSLLLFTACLGDEVSQELFVNYLLKGDSVLQEYSVLVKNKELRSSVTDTRSFSYEEHTTVISFPLFRFISHSVFSLNPLETEDGKTFSTDGGFKIKFDFANLNWEQEDSSLFGPFSTYSRLKELLEGGEYLRAIEAEDLNNLYGRVMLLIDFGNSYIEIAKKENEDFIPVEMVELSSASVWDRLLEDGNLIVSKDNDLFREPGLYQIRFHFCPIWLASEYYENNPMWGAFNEQDEFFYIQLESSSSKILLNDLESETLSFYELSLLSATEDKLYFEPNASIKTVGITLQVKFSKTKGERIYTQFGRATEFKISLFKYEIATKEEALIKEESLRPQDGIALLAIDAEEFLAGTYKIIISYQIWWQNYQEIFQYRFMV